MSQTERIVAGLKALLKARGMTYAELGSRIGLSEASVKRIFSRNTFTLARLDAICGALETSLLQVAKAGQEAEPADLSVLNAEQEKALAESFELLRYFYQLLGGLTPERIEKEMGLARAKSERHLLRLDRLGLLELHPGRRVRLLVTRPVRWLDDGPLMRRYGRRLREDFFSRPFDQGDDWLRFVPGRLSASSLARLKARLRKLMEEYQEMNEVDREIPESQTREVALLLALRPWSPAPLMDS